MTKCFKDHPCDTQRLNYNTVPIAECKTHWVDLQQRMVFVLEAAKRFEQMLHDFNRAALVQSINDIAAGTAP